MATATITSDARDARAVALVDEIEQAAAAYAASHPDGWALDPEAEQALIEHLWETSEFRGGPEAALVEARRLWGHHMTFFRAGALGENAGYLLALARLGAQYATQVAALLGEVA